MFKQLGVILGLVLGSILFTLAPVIVPLFGELSLEVKDTVIIILRVYSIYAPIKFLNAIMIVGILRSGGDTKFALVIEIVSLWLIGVPLAFILSYFTVLPLYIIIALVNIEEITKFLLAYRRSRSGRWINNLTYDHALVETII